MYIEKRVKTERIFGVCLLMKTVENFQSVETAFILAHDCRIISLILNCSRLERKRNEVK